MKTKTLLLCKKKHKVEMEMQVVKTAGKRISKSTQYFHNLKSVICLEDLSAQYDHSLFFPFKGMAGLSLILFSPLPPLYFAFSAIHERQIFNAFSHLHIVKIRLSEHPFHHVLG